MAPNHSKTPKPSKSSSNAGSTIVYIDLEATGLEPNREIIQIAAKCGEKTFNEYILPINGIPDRIKDLTGLYMSGEQMYSHSGPVTGVSKAIGFTNFLKFLESLGGRAILVAHNCFKFDGIMLAGMAIQLNMTEQFRKVVSGFSDTLPLFKKYLPWRDGRGNAGYGLVAMANEYLGDSSGAHDAQHDVIMLERLVMHERIQIKVRDIVGTKRNVNFMVKKIERHWRLWEEDPTGWRKRWH